jgi:hypothetical protein
LGKVSKLKYLLQSPFTFAKAMHAKIERETEHARKGKSASIIAKMNGLVEPDIIRALYKASQAGVQIDLIVRGMCSLRPGVPGLSENIRVRSVVGRFLEHHRVIYFHNAGQSCFCPAPTGWSAICSAASKWRFRFSTRNCATESLSSFTAIWRILHKAGFCRPMALTAGPKKSKASRFSCRFWRNHKPDVMYLSRSLMRVFISIIIEI